ncbi:hypothetical protein BC829DRAFT_60870 [Chytridium lagenaria]|nr:hypothetical protein BC829DRAFT_60870 [Chytridium lagenaria]
MPSCLCRRCHQTRPSRGTLPGTETKLSALSMAALAALHLGSAFMGGRGKDPAIGNLETSGAYRSGATLLQVAKIQPEPLKPVAWHLKNQCTEEPGQVLGLCDSRGVHGLSPVSQVAVWRLVLLSRSSSTHRFLTKPGRSSRVKRMGLPQALSLNDGPMLI